MSESKHTLEILAKIRDLASKQLKDVCAEGQKAGRKVSKGMASADNRVPSARRGRDPLPDGVHGHAPVREQFEMITAGDVCVITVDVTHAAGVGTGSVAEAGIFNASSSGVMFNRVSFSAVSKGARDTLKVSFTMTATAS